jgi:hypothetical protein
MIQQLFGQTLRTATTLSESLFDDMARRWQAQPTKVKQLILRLS